MTQNSSVATEQPTQPLPDTGSPSLDPDAADLEEDFDERATKVIADVRKDYKRERAQRQAVERKAAEYERQIKAAADAQMSAEEKANEKAREAEAKAEGYRDRAVKSEVRALAAAEFADPEDAAAFLDLSHYLDDQGDVDTAAIKADLAALLERKPHLARSGRPGPRPDASQGSGGNGRPAPATDSDKFVQWWQRTDPRRS